MTERPRARRVATGALLTITAMAISMWAPPAMAVGPSDEAEGVVDTALDGMRAAGVAVPGDGSFSAADGRAVATTGQMKIESPEHATSPISVRGNGLDLNISLPYGQNVGAAEIVDGNVVYATGDDSPSFVIQALPGAVRVMATLNSPDSPRELPFDLGLAEGVSLQVETDGSVSAFASFEGVTVSVKALEAPWAVDGNGSPVATHYTVTGSTVNQIVSPDANAVYPITADSTTCTSFCYFYKISFNKAETRTAANPGTFGLVVTACTGIGALLGGPVGAAAVGAACAVASVAISGTAQTGANSRPFRCLRIDLYWPSAIPVPRTYTGENCT